MTDTPDTEPTGPEFNGPEFNGPESNGPDPIEDIILALVAAAPENRSVSPADVAKAVDPERFSRKFGHVRQAAIRLAKAGKVTILRKGKPVEDPEAFKGVWRIGRA